MLWTGRRLCGRPARGTGFSPRTDLQDGVAQLEGRPLCTSKTCASVKLAFTGDDRWFPERNLYGTPLSVRASRNFHAIQRTKGYGGAWPKGGSGALSWPNSKTRSRKVTESERKAALAGLNNILLKHFPHSIPNADHLDDGRGQISERTRRGWRAGPHHCRAKSPRGTKTTRRSRLCRKSADEHAHYALSDHRQGSQSFGCRALALARESTDGHPES